MGYSQSPLAELRARSLNESLNRAKILLKAHEHDVVMVSVTNNDKFLIFGPDLIVEVFSLSQGYEHIKFTVDDKGRGGYFPDH